MFNSRIQAATLLGEELVRRNVRADVVLGLARGGVVVAAEVAKILGIPFDVIVVRKIGAPGSPEFAVGAMAEDMVWWDEETVRRLGLTDTWKKEQVELKQKEVEEYRKQLVIFPYKESSTTFSRARRRPDETSGRPYDGNMLAARETSISASSNSIILADDGAATGTSMMAAIQAIRRMTSKGLTLASAKVRPYQILVALPVASVEAANQFRKLADDVILLEEGSFLSSVGQYYRDFSQVEWAEVRRLLQLSHEDYVKTHP